MIGKLCLFLFFFTAHQSLAWEEDFGEAREEYNETEIMAWEAPQEIQERFPYYLASHVDKTPVWVFPFGSWKLNKEIRRDREVISKWVNQLWFRLRNSGREEGANGFLLIFDCKGFGIFKNGDIGFISEKMKMIGEIMTRKDVQQAFIIRGGLSWDVYWLLGKSLLGEVQEQCQNFAFGSNDWKPVLKQWIPEENLPSTYGGSLEDPEQVYG